MSGFMAKPCAQCPFRIDVKPFLRADRAEEIAWNAEDRFGSFPCHKTLEADDSEFGDGESMVVETSKECAGHLTMQFAANGQTYYDDEGFKPADNCYPNSGDMTEAYEDAWP
jgi:hypothetical protein